MKVVSLNLWNGGRLFEAAVEFITTQAADVYFLQEAYNGQGDHLEDRFRTVELLTHHLPGYDCYFAPVYIDVRAKEGKIEDGQLLLSKRPLLKRENFFLDLPLGEYDQDGTADFSHWPVTLQKATIEWEGQLITLLNVHGPVNFNGTEDTDRRLKMKELILNHITDQTIVAGDFNVQPQTQTIREIATQMTDVFAPLHRTTSFNLQRKDLTTFPGYATAVVDMMFVSPSFQVLKAEMPAVDVSDHLPLVAELAASGA